MAKVETDLLKKVLEKNVTSVRERNSVLNDLKAALEQEALNKEMKPPATKKEFIFLVSDPKNALAAYPEGVSGWVLQIEEGEAPHGALDRLHTAAYEHNASLKGRKLPVGTIGDACESVPAKVLKEAGLWVKTKVPVLVLRTDNKLPKAPGLPD